MDGRAGWLIGLVGIVAVGAGAAGETSAPAPAASDKRQKATLVVNLTSEPGFTFDQGDYVLVEAAGDPPETASLVDASGLVSADVASADEASCGDVPLRHTGLDGERWCLRLSGLDVGNELTGTLSGATGTLSGATTDLELKVSQRYHFRYGPLLVIVIGILAGAFVTWLTTKKLPRYVMGGKLDEAVSRLSAVSGLREWATRLSRANGPTATLEAVQKLEQFGLPKVKTLRSALSVAVAASKLPDTHPILVKARAEAVRDEHAITDFYGSDGEAVTEHSAATLEALLSRAGRLKERLDEAKARIDSIRDAPEGLKDLLRAAREQLVGAATTTDLDDAERGVSQVEDRVADAVVTPGSVAIARFLTADRAGEQGVMALIGAGFSSTTAPPAPLAPAWELPDVVSAASLGKIVRGLLFLLQGALGIYAAAVAAYLPEKSFGDGGDWLALLAAAFATSAVTQIVGLATLGDTAKS